MKTHTNAVKVDQILQLASEIQTMRHDLTVKETELLQLAPVTNGHATNGHAKGSASDFFVPVKKSRKKRKARLSALAQPVVSTKRSFNAKPRGRKPGSKRGPYKKAFVFQKGLPLKDELARFFDTQPREIYTLPELHKVFKKKGSYFLSVIASLVESKELVRVGRGLYQSLSKATA